MKAISRSRCSFNARVQLQEFKFLPEMLPPNQELPGYRIIKPKPTSSELYRNLTHDGQLFRQLSSTTHHLQQVKNNAENGSNQDPRPTGRQTRHLRPHSRHPTWLYSRQNCCEWAAFRFMNTLKTHPRRRRDTQGKTICTISMRLALRFSR
jgi:hypothetical protein